MASSVFASLLNKPPGAGTARQHGAAGRSGGWGSGVADEESQAVGF